MLVYMYVRAKMYVFACMFPHMPVFTFVCMYVLMYVYIIISVNAFEYDKYVCIVGRRAIVRRYIDFLNVKIINSITLYFRFRFGYRLGLVVFH